MGLPGGVKKTLLGDGFKEFKKFHPDPRGNDPIIWRAYFSKGLVQPPTTWMSKEVSRWLLNEL